MAESKKHISKSDIFGIIIPFGFAVFAFFTSTLGFVFFYLGISLFRLLLLLLQLLLVRSDDDAKKKFTKERWISRLAGLLLLVFDVAYSGVLIIFLSKKPSTFFVEYPYLISLYALYALYKFIVGHHHLKKARRSFSPYREVICALSFFDAMVTLLNATVLIFSLTSYIGSALETAILSAIVTAITIITLIMAIKLIKSRKIPNLLQ